MTVPGKDTQARGYANPVILRVSAALAGAGAWDAAPVESSSTYADEMLLQFTYTRGGVAGAFDFQLEYSLFSVAALVPAGAAEWITMDLYAPGPVAAGADSQSRVQAEFITFQPLTANAEDFPFPVELNGVVERVRCRARESGNVGAPGTLQITAVLV